MAWLAKEVGGCFISLLASLHPGLSIGKYQLDCGAAELAEVVLQTWGKWMAGEKLVLALFSHRPGGTGEQAQQLDVTNVLAIGDWRLYLLYTRECMP